MLTGRSLSFVIIGLVFTFCCISTACTEEASPWNEPLFKITTKRDIDYEIFTNNKDVIGYTQNERSCYLCKYNYATGKIAWEKEYNETKAVPHAYIVLNEGIIIATNKETSRFFESIQYYSVETGDKIWSINVKYENSWFYDGNIKERYPVSISKFPLFALKPRLISSLDYIDLRTGKIEVGPPLPGECGKRCCIAFVARNEEVENCFVYLGVYADIPADYGKETPSVYIIKFDLCSYNIVWCNESPVYTKIAGSHEPRALYHYLRLSAYPFSDYIMLVDGSRYTAIRQIDGSEISIPDLELLSSGRRIGDNEYLCRDEGYYIIYDVCRFKKKQPKYKRKVFKNGIVYEGGFFWGFEDKYIFKLNKDLLGFNTHVNELPGSKVNIYKGMVWRRLGRCISLYDMAKF